MQREHEEAMRADFDQLIDLSDQRTHGLIRRDNPITGEQVTAISNQQEAIQDRWREGPHAEHWGYLEDAHHDWRHAPDTMRRMREDIAANGGFGVTDIEARSLKQAGALAARSEERRELWNSQARSQIDAASSRSTKRTRSTAERSR
ncbi:hypothetical protein [Nocardia asteroides]|uniref:hypothetical protein n=1 Tax=Nocardia asteroides TaxID=1824 RepID=UPI00341C3124